VVYVKSIRSNEGDEDVEENDHLGRNYSDKDHVV
jgi:hypothetical protein